MDPRKVKWQQTLISILSVTSSQCLTAYPAIRELLLGQFSNFLEARWLIWNSFNELEVEVVNWMRINSTAFWCLNVALFPCKQNLEYH
ncbi:hypothetical protein POTOM_027719 [Populus tomentosa]|uniref:Uncharacterized protein n=1 Tax=Populus tomentosa TaxID=118781 RepID=A0A8X7ZT94_POPTO|nr:hypothetical protein POTOM_027719 [Populus tomentosa]